MNYREFLENKKIAVEKTGFKTTGISDVLYPFQQEAVRLACESGRFALFEDCGLGKTLQQIEFTRQVLDKEGGRALIVAPLAVSGQTIREGEKLGVGIKRVTNSGQCSDFGVYITNYERLKDFDPSIFVCVVLDESSILKNYSGKMRVMITEMFQDTPYRLACTATPSPNDHKELGNHAEFLGIMPANEMLARWFINDTMKMGGYRLKGHAKDEFWQWVASWSVCISLPSDLGDFSDDGFILPKLNMVTESVEIDWSEGADHGELFRNVNVSASNIHKEKRLTSQDRAAKVAELVNNSSEPWAVWVDTNYEADAVMALIPCAVEVRGDMSANEKEKRLLAFSNGDERVIVTKPGIAGYGLNWQHCRNAAVMGINYSYEDLYQLMKRHHRFGQKKDVNIHLISTQTLSGVLNTLREKETYHKQMQREMGKAMKRARKSNDLTIDYTKRLTERNQWSLINGDCVDATKEMGTNSIHFSIHSPPFSNLYIYSDSIRDMGNCKDDAEFMQHYEFLIPELYRVTMPGRLAAVHCKNLVNYAGRDGRAGLRDFRGDIIRAYEKHGWQYHSEVHIWKDPVTEMHRTKAHGLLYKQLRKDSSYSRQGLAEYLILFRKWGVDHEPVTHTKNGIPLDDWQMLASPTWSDQNVPSMCGNFAWDDIVQTNVLNIKEARENKDEKHICPLQLDVIERALVMWTNENDVVYDPFAGIGSTGYVCGGMNRRFVGCELKDIYFEKALRNLEASFGHSQLDLFKEAA